MGRRLNATPPGRFAATLPIEGREGTRPEARARVAAKRLRKTLTPAEAKLWVHLKRISTVDTHFRKQVPIKSYIADFACMRAKLIVEVDGAQHGFDHHLRHDAKRTAWLESQGFTVLRFWNDDVLRDIESVLDTVYATLHGAASAPSRSFSKRADVSKLGTLLPLDGGGAERSEADGVTPKHVRAGAA